MKVFDKVDLQTLDRREMQLWLLALTTILILTAGMALLMYPAVFSEPVVLTSSTLRKAFFGFCGLSGLLIAYLVDRRLVVRNLRRQLADEQSRYATLRFQASKDLLKTLPEFSHFQDRLPMEIRRASGSKQPLSLVIVRVKPASEITDSNEVAAAFGDAAKAIVRRLQREDSIYLFAPGIFGILLPGACATAAYRAAERLVDGLHDASGASDRFASEVQVVNYPEHTETSWGMEHSVRQFFAERHLAPPWLEVEPPSRDAVPVACL